ncbi:MAG: NAD(P)-dependent alcohol dehydrogenase [Salinisphaera sp.]|nr:NAD(P)-dependent alcohol dehydrogenase [Salinisphaera sp.]
MSNTTPIKAAVVREVNTPWVIEDLTLEAPRDDELRVRLVATGMCHTDIVCRLGFPVPMPIVLGHEGAGVVEEVGAKVSGIEIGDHVVLSFNSCGDCHNCEKQMPATCYNFYPRNVSGVRMEDGSSPISDHNGAVHGMFFGQSSFATHAIARQCNAVVVDKDLPLEKLGPLGCGIQTGAGSVVNSIGIGAGESLALFGGGAVGLSGLLGARAVGAGDVVVVEPRESRRELAMELGAALTIDPTACDDVTAKIKEEMGGVNHAFDTTGIPDVIRAAGLCLLPGGILAMVGVPPENTDMPADLLGMLMGGLTAKYVIEGDADPQRFIPRMLEWYKAGKFPFDRLIGEFPFEQINEAEAASESGEVIKPVLVFNR